MTSLASDETDLEKGDFAVRSASTADGDSSDPRLFELNAVKTTVASHPCVVFSKSWCPFCIETIRLLQQYQVPLHIVQLDTLVDGGGVQAIVKKVWNFATVPAVFINGSLVGGCDAVTALHNAGQLLPLLEAAAYGREHLDGAALGGPRFPRRNLAVAEAAPRLVHSFFWFPDVVDNRASRVMALMTCVVCVLAILFREHRAMHFAVLGLFADFVVRVVAGPGPSVIAQLAKLLTAWTKPRFQSGLPLQVAVILSMTFSGTATLLFFLPLHDNGIAGAVVMGALLCATFLYGALNFCAACFMFGWLIRLKILPSHIHTAAVNTKGEIVAAWDYNNTRMEEPEPVHVRKSFSGCPSTVIDVQYKVKTDEYTMQHFNLVKYCHIGHFAAPLGWAGLAVLFKVANQPGYNLHVTHILYWACGGIAAALFAALLALFTLKAAVFPKKVRKEWQDPLRGNSFSIPPLLLMLFAYMINEEFDYSHTIAIVVFWVGAVSILVLGFIRVGDWVATRKEQEHIHAAWIKPTVGSFVMALVGPNLSAAYREAAYLWFAFALLMWIALFTITLQKAVVEASADDRLRPQLFIWVAAPAVACLAWTSLTGTVDADGIPIFDPVAKIFLFMALSLAFCLAWGFIRGFFGRSSFDMADWNYSFPIAALAIAIVQYSGDVRGSWTRGMAYTALALTTGLVVVTSLQTTVAILQRRVFRPDDKWGPISGAMKIMHRAIRDGGVPRLVRQCMALSPTSTGAIAAFADDFKNFLTVHYAHSSQEDSVLFPAVDEVFPGAKGPCADQHANLDEELAALASRVEELRTGDHAIRIRILADLQASLPRFFGALCAHMQEEEDHIQPIARKYLPLEMQKQIMRKVWAASSEREWAVLLPWVMNHLPYEQQRVRYLRSLMWAMPERAQQIGRMVALGLEATLWSRLIIHVPEMIPRGAAGWNRYY